MERLLGRPKRRQRSPVPETGMMDDLGTGVWGMVGIWERHSGTVVHDIDG